MVLSSQQAERQQVFAGMKLSEARAACADLIFVDYDEHRYKQAHQRLCRAMIGCSPKVSVLEPGMFVLDAAGLSYLGGENKFCSNLYKLVARAGFSTAQIGIADSTFAAVVASKCKRRRFFIVEKGHDQEFLSPLSIKHLPINQDMQESLYELGIRAIGQMVSLSQESLMERFGKDGVIACELARGIDSRRPSLPPQEKEFKSFVDLGSAIELLNEIQFVLKSMSDRLMRDLRNQGYCAEELQLTFFNNDERTDQRPVKLLRPSNHPKFLLEVMKLSLEAKPLQREITAIELLVSRFCQENWQQLPTANDAATDSEMSDGSPPRDISTPAPEEHHSMSLTLMLQRFISRLGEDAVVKPVPNDQHIPEHAAVWLPVAGKSGAPATPLVPVNISYVNAHVGPSALSCGLALRKLAAPQPVLVEFGGARDGENENIQPQAIAFEGRWYRVQEITVPERLSGLWWEQPVRRSYFVALIQPKEIVVDISSPAVTAASSLLVLLVHDHQQGGWYVNGMYD